MVATGLSYAATFMAALLLVLYMLAGKRLGGMSFRAHLALDATYGVLLVVAFVTALASLQESFAPLILFVLITGGSLAATLRSVRATRMALENGWIEGEDAVRTEMEHVSHVPLIGRVFSARMELDMWRAGRATTRAEAKQLKKAQGDLDQTDFF